MAAAVMIRTMSSTTPLLTIITSVLFILLSSLTILTSATAVNSVDQPNTTTPYLSPSTFHQDYQTMLSTFKLYPYTLKTTPPFNITASVPSSPIHFFHSILLHHHTFLTQNPTTAHLFYLPFPPNFSSRSLFHEINSLRSSYPYWDRSLGADHVFLSSPGTPPNSARNVVELRKNAIQITCVASSPGNFIPHKDVALPPLPLITDPIPHSTNYYYNTQTPHHLGYYFNSSTTNNHLQPTFTNLLNTLQTDPDFLINTHPHSSLNYSYRMMETSKFCLFIHSSHQGQLQGLMEAMSRGCVPVVISPSNHPIHDMPLTDLLKWQDMVVFVGQSVGPVGLKRVLLMTKKTRYKMMRELGMVAAKHLEWNDPPKPYDAFHMVMYQLWRRRHVVRYYTSQKKK